MASKYAWFWKFWWLGLEHTWIYFFLECLLFLLLEVFHPPVVVKFCLLDSVFIFISRLIISLLGFRSLWILNHIGTIIFTVITAFFLLLFRLYLFLYLHRLHIFNIICVYFGLCKLALVFAFIVALIDVLWLLLVRITFALHIITVFI